MLSPALMRLILGGVVVILFSFCLGDGVGDMMQ